MRKSLVRGVAEELLAEDEIAAAYPKGVVVVLRHLCAADPAQAAALLATLACLLADQKLHNEDGTVTTKLQLEGVVRQVVPGLKLVPVKEKEVMAKEKEFREILEELPRQGWQLTQTTQGHWRAAPPNKEMTIVHFAETKDPHGQLNIVRDLTRRGFVWPLPSKNEQKGGTDTPAQPPPPSDPIVVPRRPYIKLHTNGVAGKPTFAEALAGIPGATQSSDEPEESIASGPERETKPVEKTEDQLFSELKEARLYDNLAGEHLKECQRAVEEATQALAAADREKKKAAEDLEKKRAALFGKYAPS